MQFFAGVFAAPLDSVSNSLEDAIALEEEFKGIRFQEMWGKGDRTPGQRKRIIRATRGALKMVWKSDGRY